MAGRRVCILVAIFDVVCFNIILELLSRCNHELLHIGGPIETLSAICERKEIVGVVLTNLHRIQSQVTNDILYHIEKKLRVQTCFMEPDNTMIELTTEGANGGFAAFIVHSMDDLLNFWTMSSIKSTEVPRFVDITSHIMSSSFSLASASASTSTSTSGSASDTAGDGDDKMFWIEEIARKFLIAAHTLPPRDIVPKKILDHMGRPAGLDRKHVSSHLQKHRLRAKKYAEAMKKKASGVFAFAPTVVPRAPPMPFSGSYYNYLMRSRIGSSIISTAPNLVIREAPPPPNDRSQVRELAPPNVSATHQAPLQNISENPSWQQQTVQVDVNDALQQQHAYAPEEEGHARQQQVPEEEDNAWQQPSREEDEDIDGHIQHLWDEYHGNARQEQQAPEEEGNARQQQQARAEEVDARQQPARAEDEATRAEDEDIDWHIQNFWDEDQGPPSLD